MEFGVEPVQIAISAVTAFASVALVGATYALMRATGRLADVSSQPMVVATLEPSIWDMSLIELVIANTGNASAFNIKISFTPDLTKEGEHGNYVVNEISLLRPDQSIKSFLSEANAFLNREFHVEASWQKHPESSQRDAIAYSLDMRNYANQRRLGAVTPEVQIAQQLKRLREDWKNIAHGKRRVGVDSHSAADRQKEDEDRQAMFEKFIKPKSSG